MSEAHAATRGAERNWAALLERLGSDDFGERMEAGAALCGAGEASVRMVTAGLNDARWKVRWRCAEWLGHLAEEDDQEPLRRALTDPVVRVRQAAVHAFLSVPCHSPAVQASVTEALAGCAESDPSVTVRRSAINGLGMQPFHTRAVQTLRALSERDTAPRLRRLAEWALRQQERKKAGETAPKRGPELPGARDILALGPGDDLPLPETLAASQLVGLLGAAERRLRFEATGVLFHRGRASLDAVVTGLSHPSVVVRRACASLLDHLADDRCVVPLSEALRDSDEQVRRSALHSLTCDACKPSPLQGDLVVPLIKRALHDRNIRVRRVATGVLGDYVHDDRAVAALRTIHAQDTDFVLRSRAESALEKAAQGAD